MTPTIVDRADSWEVWQGDCLDAATAELVMHGRKADLLCFDAPYSEKCHQGHEAGKHTAQSMANFAKRNADNPTSESRHAMRKSQLGEGRRSLEYAPWGQSEIDSFCAIWVPRTNGWVVSITDDVLAPMWQRSLEASGFYAFAPLPLVETGSRCRMAGDGPSAWTTWVVVARPRTPEFKAWGTTRGAYVVPGERDFNLSDSGRNPSRVVGAKPLMAMQQIVYDYSRRGALVVDPTSGGGTTLRAALGTGRRCIGIEQDPGRAELSAKACRSVNIGQRELFGDTP